MSRGTTKTNDILCYLFTATTGHLQAYRWIDWNMGKGVEEGSPQLNASHLGAGERQIGREHMTKKQTSPSKNSSISNFRGARLN
jgi:hypothetical protein